MNRPPRLFAATLLALCGGAGYAQTAQDRALQECLRVADDGPRLACLEGVLSEAGMIVPPQKLPASSTPGAAIDSEPPDEGLVIHIVEIRRTQLGETSFVTRDGRIYMQRSANRGRYPAVPFDAELQTARQDSYFLISPSGGPRVRVALSD